MQHVLLGKYLAIVLAIAITKVLLLHVNILDNVLHIESHCKRFRFVLYVYCQNPRINQQ